TGKAMAQHSSLVGGSTADRILNCPASWSATMALPPSANRSSEFADEGTAMHEVMKHLMLARGADETRDMHAEAGALIGTKFHDRVLTQDHLDTMIHPALDALSDLEARYGGGFWVSLIEAPVNFPGIPGAHGTCDLILGKASCMLH